MAENSFELGGSKEHGGGMNWRTNTDGRERSERTEPGDSLPLAPTFSKKSISFPSEPEQVEMTSRGQASAPSDADAGAGGPRGQLRLPLAQASLGAKDMLPVISGIILVGGRPVELFNDQHFQKLREMHGVVDKFLADLSLDKQLPKISKGNAPLFRTDDEEFIIKAMSSSDHGSMLDLTPAFCDRLTQGSLLSPIYLHFRFPALSQTRMAGRQSVAARGLEDADVDADKEQLNWPSYIAMRNLTPNVGTYKGRYDLKGCDDDKTLENEGCRVEAVHRRWWHFWYCKCCWSPARWIYWHSKQDAKQFRVAMPTEQQKEVTALLEEDVRWLQDQELMDYSLLVGVQRFTAEDAEEFAIAGVGSSGLLSALHSQVTLGALPTGRQCWVHLDSEVERRLHVTIQTREELERGAVNRIREQIERAGLDPREWDFFLEGVAEDPRKSMTPERSGRRTVKKDDRLMASNFPRSMAVRLVKKTRDRPLTMVTIAIIDFLQDWTCKKKMASWLKCCEPNKATIAPDAYGERFLEHFKQQITEGPGLEAEPGCPETPPIVKPATHTLWQLPYVP